jgi:hypothetical protein
VTVDEWIGDELMRTALKSSSTSSSMIVLITVIVPETLENMPI